MSATCDSCGAPVEWVETENGRPMPVDVERVELGNIVLSHRSVGKPPIAHVLLRVELATAETEHEAKVQAGIEKPGALLLYRSHFASCPQAAAWRKKAKA